MTTDQKREAVEVMCEVAGLSQRRACRLTGSSLSTCRYDARRPAADTYLSRRITELALERRRFGYRRIWQLLHREGLHVNHKRVYRIVDSIALFRGYPATIRTDQGPGFTCRALDQWAFEHGVELRLIQPGKPTQNAFIERLNRTYRTEILDFYLFRTLNEAREITER